MTAPVVTDAEDRLISLDEMCQLLGVGRTLAKQLVQRDGFPASAQFTQRSVRWWRSQVVAWVEEQRHRTSRRTAAPSTAPLRRPRRRHQ